MTVKMDTRTKKGAAKASLKEAVKTPTVLVWFRSDLRLHDNPALASAIQSGYPVVPVFVLDDNLLRNDPLAGSARVLFMLDCLRDLDKNLRERGSYLILRYASPIEEIPRLCLELGATAVYYNQDVDRQYGIERDAAVQAKLERLGIRLIAERQYAVWPVKDDHDHYKEEWRKFNASKMAATPETINTPADIPTRAVPIGLNELGVEDLQQEGQPGGESVALELFQQFINAKLNRYYFAVSYPEEADENEATSLLSPHLKFGTISGRRCIQTCARILKHEGDMLSASERKSLERFITRLRWRESMYQSLFIHPESEFMEYQPIYRGVRRPATGPLYEAYLNGQTGYPMIDAGIRCMKRTGKLAFRIRAAVASFLCYGLFMNPQAGKDFFYKYLIDSNPINSWQWQLQAGTVGYSKFFQIFNPTVQAKKYDPEGKFIKKWCPELKNVPIEVLAEPWRMTLIEQYELGCVIGRDYPARIIDWKTARQQARATLDPLRLSLAEGDNFQREDAKTQRNAEIEEDAAAEAKTELEAVAAVGIMHNEGWLG